MGGVQGDGRGAINPRTAFRYAYRHGADFIIAGMFDFQVETDVKIAIESLKKALTANGPGADKSACSSSKAR